MRLKAKSLGMRVQDYYTDRVSDIEKLYSGRRMVLDFPSELIDKLYSAVGVLDSENTALPDLFPNEYLILKNQQKSVLVYFNPQTNMIHRVEKKNAYGIKPRNAE